MGNPHCVQFVPDAEAVDLAGHGPGIEHDPLFPQRTNVEFASLSVPGRLRLRVWERGTGITLACGSGACAAVVSGIKLGLLQSPVRVSMRGGDLNISWNGDKTPVWMTGPATTVFEGVMDIGALTVEA